MAFQQKVLKECTKILLEIENNRSPDNEDLDTDSFCSILEERYNIYKQRKQSKNMQVLARHEFIALCCITAERESNKPFLFEKTKLSFTIMCSNCDTNIEPMVNLKQFEKWATKLYPLATKQNYKRIFLALANDINDDIISDINDDDTRKGSFGKRVRQHISDYKNSNKNNNIREVKERERHDKIIYGGILMNRFCGYVTELYNNFNIEQNECGQVKLSLEQIIQPHERILYHIRGVSDMTGLPPYYGFVILTDYHLIFQGTALTTRTTAIKLNDNKLSIERCKIGGFLKRDTALKIYCDLGTFTWNVVNIKNTRRDELYWSIWTMRQAHKLCQNIQIILNENNKNKNSNELSNKDEELIMKIKRKIIVEAADDVLRQNSLQNLFEKNKYKEKFDCVAFVRYATRSQKKLYVVNISEELNDIEYSQNSNKSMMSSLFGFGSSNIDDEKNNKFIDPDNEIKLQEYKQLKNDFERENKMKKLNVLVDKKREEFELKQFFKYLKILRIEFEPAMFLYRLYKCIVGWKNKGLSLFILVILEIIAYLNLVHYIPAFLLIFNGILLISMKNDMEYTLQCFDNLLIYAGFDPDEFDQEKLAAENYTKLKYGKNINLNELNEQNKKNKKKNKWSIMHKIKVARYKFYYNTFTMGFHQKK
eukprot:123332_1